MPNNQQNFGFRISDRELGGCHASQLRRRSAKSALRNPQSAIPPRSAFTLTELLVVIAIIAILAGLAATAAVSAMKAARRSSISLELKQLAGAMENFKNDFGAYPPNGMNPNNAASTGPVATMLQSDFEGMFKKAFPNHKENPQLIRALCGQSNDSNLNLQNGMNAAEALYFWLGGFSDDELYPISGPRGPSFLVVNGDPSDEVVEDRNRKYEFDLTRLQPVTDAGVFDESNGGRYIVYPDPKNSNQRRRINFWRYNAKGSEQPFVYFDVSRHKPGPFTTKGRYDCWAVNPETNGTDAIFALKTRRRGVANVNNNFNNMLFVEQGKFQILHCGLDDDWGPDLALTGSIVTPGNGAKNANDVLLFPDGPFLREAADTLTNFTDGTLADAQEASK